MITAPDTERYAEIVCTYLSELTESEIIEAIRNVSFEDMKVLLLAAVKLEKYELCSILQKTADAMSAKASLF